MREILFRGKRKDNGEWMYGHYTEYKGVAQLWVDSDDGQWNYLVDPDTVGQYTGLTDKNGKKIFEGDIIEYKDECGEIVYQDNEAMFYVSFDTWCTDFDHLCGKNIEVIGNIHDNPELLGGG